MANISEITIELPLQGFTKAVKKNFKKIAAAKVSANLQKKADENGTTVPTEILDKLKKIVGSETPLMQTADTTKNFITNEEPQTYNNKTTAGVKNEEKKFPWWIVAAAGVGLLLLNSKDKKRKK